MQFKAESSLTLPMNLHIFAMTRGLQVVGEKELFESAEIIFSSWPQSTRVSDALDTLSDTAIMQNSAASSW